MPPSCKVTALEVDAIKRILTSVLHLGNAKFSGSEDSPAELDGTEAVDTVAELLQINEGKLRGALISRTMSTGGGRGRGDFRVLHFELDADQTIERRTAWNPVRNSELRSEFPKLLSEIPKCRILNLADSEFL